MTRVLIADDHPSFRASARELSKKGFDVCGKTADGAGTLSAPA